MWGRLMKSFACGDVVPGCDAHWLSETEDEVLQQVRQHARDVHGLQDIPEGVLQSVRRSIVSVE